MNITPEREAAVFNAARKLPVGEQAYYLHGSCSVDGEIWKARARLPWKCCTTFARSRNGSFVSNCGGCGRVSIRDQAKPIGAESIREAVIERLAGRDANLGDLGPLTRTA